jgi:hypothetical protein
MLPENQVRQLLSSELLAERGSKLIEMYNKAQLLNALSSGSEVPITCSFCGTYSEVYEPAAPDYWDKLNRKTLVEIELKQEAARKDICDKWDAKIAKATKLWDKKLDDLKSEIDTCPETNFDWYVRDARGKIEMISRNLNDPSILEPISRILSPGSFDIEHVQSRVDSLKFSSSLRPEVKRELQEYYAWLMIAKNSDKAASKRARLETKYGSARDDKEKELQDLETQKFSELEKAFSAIIKSSEKIEMSEFARPRASKLSMLSFFTRKKKAHEMFSSTVKYFVCRNPGCVGGKPCLSLMLIFLRSILLEMRVFFEEERHGWPQVSR